VVGGEGAQIVGVVREDHASAKPDGRGNHEGVDGRVAVSTCAGQEVAGDPRDAEPGGDDARITPAELLVDRLVDPGAPVELDKGVREGYRRSPRIL
jgi:hypothetical protein